MSSQEPTSSPCPSQPDATERFLALAQRHLQTLDLHKLLLANPLPAAGDLERVHMRPVQIKGQAQWSLLYKHRTRDITKNILPEEVPSVLRSLLGHAFRNAHLYTASHEVQWALSKKGKASLRTGKVAADQAPPASAGHNREKHRMLPLDRPFLAALGITTPRHDLVPAMARKWKQINKFLEVFDHAWRDSQLAAQDEVRVVDFGSGKGYLTFAVHDHLTHLRGQRAQVLGVDLKQDMIDLCNRAARELGHEGLRFEHGDVRERPAGEMDVMIALHACDIATDHAIHTGVLGGSQIILCSPCCHKQIRPQLLSPHPMRPILRHGIHLGQEAEMLTDSLRALLLEACGYDTQVFEFISLEHTNKNKMILAVKRPHGAPEDGRQAMEQVRELKDFYRIQEHCLETLLRGSGVLG